jgi:hypothetical protein
MSELCPKCGGDHSLFAYCGSRKTAAYLMPRGSEPPAGAGASADALCFSIAALEPIEPTTTDPAFNDYVEGFLAAKNAALEIVEQRAARAAESAGQAGQVRKHSPPFNADYEREQHMFWRAEFMKLQEKVRLQDDHMLVSPGTVRALVGNEGEETRLRALVTKWREDVCESQEEYNLMSRCADELERELHPTIAATPPVEGDK